MENHKGPKRAILPLLLSAMLGCSGEQTVGPADPPAADETEDTVDLLFVQYAQRATLADGVLTLYGVKDDTLYFSDRPDRIVGRMETDAFVEMWGEGDDSFADNPPNAVLAVLQEPLPVDLVAVLRDPVVDGDTLMYQVEVLDGPDSGEGLATALFIDVIGVKHEVRQEVRQEKRQEVRQEVRQEKRQTRRRVDRRL